MIGRLTGKLLEKNPPALLLDVQGVGYELESPMSTFYALPEVGEPLTLCIHMVVREDAQLLYGFASLNERMLFRTLLKVNGVGAKVALSIMSGLSVDDFVNCVAAKDVAMLVKVPGIGKKTAERLLVEMQDKFEGLTPAVTQSVPGAAIPQATKRTQAEEALIALGYKAAEAAKLLKQTATDDQSVEQMIRSALQSAGR